MNASETTGTAAVLIPPRPSLRNLRRAAADCRACPLWKTGTQTVFGEGAPGSEVLFVGEVPGDEEDRAGRPFVGPAGRLLDQVLEQTGLDRKTIYVTNAVKHFKWEPHGKRRLHKKPSAREMAACRPWLDAEIQTIKPRVIVCLGATAAQALLGKEFRVSRQRGQWISSPLAPFVMATVHPASILRAPDDESRRLARQAFTDDLKKVARVVRQQTGKSGGRT